MYGGISPLPDTSLLSTGVSLLYLMSDLLTGGVRRTRAYFSNTAAGSIKARTQTDT